VRRHYNPHDAVITRDSAGDPFENPVSPGVEIEPGLVVYRFGVGLFYANSSRLSEEVLSLVDGATPPKWLILLADAIDDVDFTGGETLVELAAQLKQRDVAFAFAAVDDGVLTELERFGLVDAIGKDRIFATLDDAVATFKAS